MAQTAHRYAITVSTFIDASPSEAWDLLVDQNRMGRLFWDSTVESDFVPGHPIIWKGTWQGKPFEDRGSIRKAERPRLLQCTHWTASSGDFVEENLSLLTWELSAEKGGVTVTFRHENIPTPQMRLIALALAARPAQVPAAHNVARRIGRSLQQRLHPGQ